MRKIFPGYLIALSLALATLSNCLAQSSAKSQWVYLNSQGKLNYKTLGRGDEIIDFSFAGYMGGGVRIPSVPVEITLSPLAGDNTDAIQNSINKVSQMEMINGFRGTILFRPGRYDCERTLKINASGVVLRGSGSGTNGSILNLTGKQHTCIEVRGAGTSKTVGQATTIADTYVPAGGNSFSVMNASGFAVGDTIRITRPITDGWIKFMGMDQLYRSGKKQTWVSGDITTERIIAKIEKDKITVDVP